VSQLGPLLVLGAGGHGKVVADAAGRPAGPSPASSTTLPPWMAPRSGDWASSRSRGSARTNLACSPPPWPWASVTTRRASEHTRGSWRKASGSSRSFMPRRRLPHRCHGRGDGRDGQRFDQPRRPLGQGCIVNTGAVVEHDCQLGDYVHSRQRRTRRSGDPRRQDPPRAWLGRLAGYLHRPRRSGGRWGCVIRDAGDSLTLVGVPARPIGRK